jgi:hypothetical protein
MIPPRFAPAPWIYPFALFGAGMVIAIAFHANYLTPKDILSPVLSVFGTFFGATFAFRLNEAKEAKKLSEVRREAINRALFTLIRQANAAHQLVLDLQKYRAAFDIAFNMPAIQPPAYVDLVINFSELDFLLDSSDPSLLLRLTIEQERFQQMISTIRIRNEFYVSEIQQAMSQHRLNGTKTSLDELKQLFGERLFWGAYNGAKEVWQHVTSTALSVPVVHKELHKLAKEIFPGRKFMSYEITVDPDVELGEPFAAPPVFSKTDYRWQ